MANTTGTVCRVCHNLDRTHTQNHFTAGPSRHLSFKRYYEYKEYHAVTVTFQELQFSSGSKCQLCMILSEIFRWLTRTKARGLHEVHEPELELCIPHDSRYPFVVTFSWLPTAWREGYKRLEQMPRQYDFELAVPEQSHQAPWNAMSVGQQIPSNPVHAMFKPQTWLRDCLQNHTACQNGVNGVPKVMPKRLVYIGEDDSKVRLVDHFDSAVPYIALSYCWGPPHQQVTKHHTKHHNYNSRLQNIPWALLPATYHDAIHFTRAMGYLYIWIDALCIIQGDKLDWSYQAERMASTFSEAVLVISASNTSHVNFGMFHERPGSRIFKNKLHQSPSDPTHVLVQEPTVHSSLLGGPEQEEQWPAFRRAWTLQERILATRLVHFAAGEMVWECASSCACECGYLQHTGAVTSRRRYDLAGLEQMSALECARLWDQLAFSYQNRSLSKDEDRLSGLSGLAHRFGSEKLGSYCAGLWSKFLIGMMLWEVKSGRRASEYVAPTWSFLEFQGRLSRENPVEPNSAFVAEVKDVFCELETDDPFGAIKRYSGYVDLVTPAIDGWIVWSEHRGDPNVQLSDDVQAFLVSDRELENSQLGGMVKCIFPRGLHTGPRRRYIEALVLEVDKHMRGYRRIGIAHMMKHKLGKTQEEVESKIKLNIETVRIV